MKLVRIFVILSFLISQPVGVLAQSENVDTTFSIGIAMPLSGTTAFLGDGMQKGIELAMRDLPQELRDRIVIHIDDDQGAPKNTVSIFQKHRSSHDIDLFVAIASNTSNAVSPIAERLGTPMIAVASDFEIVRDKKSVVALWVPPEREAEKMWEEIVRRGYKRIARITSQHDGTLAFKKVTDELNPGDAEIVFDVEVPLSETDFRAIISRLKQLEDVDAIFVNLFVGGPVGSFTKQAREAGLRQPFVGFEMFEDKNEVKISDGALIGGWYVQASLGTPEFVSRFRKKYPDASLFGAANAYDIVMLAAKGVKEGKTSPSDFLKLLHTLEDFSGALGTYSASGDNRFTLPAVVKVVTEDGFEVFSGESR